jgi:hypothetical protein
LFSLEKKFFSKRIGEEPEFQGRGGQGFKGPGIVVYTFFLTSFIFFHVKENEPKENARKTLVSCASHSVRRAVKLAALKQSQLFCPHPAAMLDAS